MDLIYKCATEVLVWLGPETSGSTQALRFMENLKKNHDVDYMLEVLPQHFPFTEDYCPECSADPHHQTDLSQHPGFKDMYHRATSSHWDHLWGRINRIAPIPATLWDNQQIALIESFLDIIDRSWWKRVWVRTPG